MMNKIIPFVMMINVCAVPMLASAVPLDPEHFQAGVWKGTYLSESQTCYTRYAGKAVLTITNPVYSSPSKSQHESSVHFDGRLELQGMLPKRFSKQIDLSNASVIQRKFPDYGEKYFVTLYSQQQGQRGRQWLLHSGH